MEVAMVRTNHIENGKYNLLSALKKVTLNSVIYYTQLLSRIRAIQLS